MSGKIIEEPTYRERVFVFQDMLQAGSILPEKLREYAGQENVGQYLPLLTLIRTSTT